MSRRSTKWSDDDVLRTQELRSNKKLKQTLDELAQELEDRPVSAGRKSAQSPYASPKRPRGRPPKSPRQAAGRDVPLMSDFVAPRRASPKRAPVRIVSSDWEERPQSYGRSNPSLVGAASYDATMDPEGAAMLYSYLQENYNRITLNDACDEQIDVANDGRPDVAIWVKTGNRWRQMDRDSEVMALWARRLKNKPGSVCQSLVKDLLGLSERDYEKLRQKFDQTSGYIEGVYKVKPSKAKEVEKFAVVVKMPSGMSVNDKWVKAGLGGLAGLATAAAAGAGLYGYRTRGQLKDVYTGNTKDWRDPIQVVAAAIEANRRATALNSKRDQAVDANKKEAERLENELPALESRLAKYRFYLAQAALAEAKAKADEAKGDAATLAKKELEYAKARAIEAAVDTYKYKQQTLSDIKTALTDAQAAKQSYETLFSALQDPIASIVDKVKKDTALTETEVTDLKKHAAELFLLGDQIKGPGLISAIRGGSAVKRLGTKPSAKEVKKAIISDFPDLILKFTDKTIFKEDADTLKAAQQLAVLYSLAPPDAEGEIHKYLEKIQNKKYGVPRGVEVAAIQKIVSGARVKGISDLIAELDDAELADLNNTFKAERAAAASKVAAKIDAKVKEKNGLATDGSNESEIEQLDTDIVNLTATLRKLES